jgi:23S rRNA pseudouridine2605 synthase
MTEKATKTLPTDSEAKERIAKRMARAGLCSRRDAEKWILAGRVKLNGKTLETPAITVTASDAIEVDGKLLQAKERTRLWLYHKPSGLVTTNRDPEGRKTVFEALPESLPRVISVGRLDINTEGLLLLTNDGGLARELELPDTGWLRRYRVRAHGSVSQAQLDGLKEGIAVNGVLYGPIEALIDREQGSNIWLTLAFREGKNREVKEVLGSLGLSVNRLIRVSYGPFQLGDMPAGTIREIRGRMLREQLGTGLITRSGADFDAPIINQAEDIARSAAKVPTKPAEAKERSHRTPRDRPKRGQADDQALARVATKSPAKKPGRLRSATANPITGKPARPKSFRGKPGADRRR